MTSWAEFDFLTWPEIVYKLIYNKKGFPNRWRVDKYKELAGRANLHVKELSPTDRLAPGKIDLIYPKLAEKFSHIPHEELSWKGFWLVLEHAQ